MPETVSWVAAAVKPCRVTLSNVTGLSPTMARGALVSVSPDTCTGPASVVSRLPPLIAGVAPAGAEMKVPSTRIGDCRVMPVVWAEMSRSLKWEPVPWELMFTSTTPPVANATL